MKIDYRFPLVLFAGIAVGAGIGSLGSSVLHAAPAAYVVVEVDTAEPEAFVKDLAPLGQKIVAAADTSHAAAVPLP